MRTAANKCKRQVENRIGRQNETRNASLSLFHGISQLFCGDEHIVSLIGNLWNPELFSSFKTRGYGWLWRGKCFANIDNYHTNVDRSIFILGGGGCFSDDVGGGGGGMARAKAATTTILGVAVNWIIKWHH